MSKRIVKKIKVIEEEAVKVSNVTIGNKSIIGVRRAELKRLREVKNRT